MHFGSQEGPILGGPVTALRHPSAMIRPPTYHAIRGLAPVTTAEQLSRLLVLDGWLAIRLVESIRSWLTWKPLSYHLQEVLWFVENTAWFPEGERQWAYFLLSLPTPRIHSAAYQQRWELELDQRAYFRADYLLCLPPDVARLVQRDYIQEGYAIAPPHLRWVYLLSLVGVADIILAQNGMQSVPRTARFRRDGHESSLSSLARWAKDLLRIRLSI